MGPLLGREVIGVVEEAGGEAQQRFRQIEIADVQRGIDTLAQQAGPAGRTEQAQRYIIQKSSIVIEGGVVGGGLRVEIPDLLQRSHSSAPSACARRGKSGFRPVGRARMLAHQSVPWRVGGRITPTSAATPSPRPSQALRQHAPQHQDHPGRPDRQRHDREGRHAVEAERPVMTATTRLPSMMSSGSPSEFPPPVPVLYVPIGGPTVVVDVPTRSRGWDTVAALAGGIPQALSTVRASRVKRSQRNFFISDLLSLAAMGKPRRGGLGRTPDDIHPDPPNSGPIIIGRALFPPSNTSPPVPRAGDGAFNPCCRAAS